MSLLALALYLLVGFAAFALLAWVVQQIPGDETIKRIGRVLAIALVCLWLLAVVASFFGVALPIPGAGRLR